MNLKIIPIGEELLALIQDRQAPEAIPKKLIQKFDLLPFLCHF